jgi:hypothetical protein
MENVQSVTTRKKGQKTSEAGPSDLKDQREEEE